mgnify:FL=1
MNFIGFLSQVINNMNLLEFPIQSTIFAINEI